MSNLMVQNGKRVSFEDLKKVPCPKATKSWTPISHHNFADDVKKMAESHNLVLGTEEYSFAKENNQCFGTIEVTNYKNSDNSIQFIMGIRNSTDKSLSAGVCFGTKVIVCSNLAFIAYSDDINRDNSFVVKRRHTRFIMRDLPAILNEAMSKALYAKDIQETMFEKMRNTNISRIQVHDILIKAMECGAISNKDIKNVLDLYIKQANEPITEKAAEKENWYPEFQERTYYSLHNMFTENYKKDFDRNAITTVHRSIQLTNLFRRELSVN